MRLIDADALMDNISKKPSLNLFIHAKNIEAAIDETPTIDAEPVRHGRYDEGEDCTVCGYPMPTDDRCDAIFPQEIKYCYNCGAKMDLEVQDDA